MNFLVGGNSLLALQFSVAFRYLGLNDADSLSYLAVLKYERVTAILFEGQIVVFS